MTQKKTTFLFHQKNFLKSELYTAVFSLIFDLDTRNKQQLTPYGYNFQEKKNILATKEKFSLTSLLSAKYNFGSTHRPRCTLTMRVSLISERTRTGTNGHERTRTVTNGHERSRTRARTVTNRHESTEFAQQAFYAHRVAPSDGDLSTRSRNGGTGECGQRSGVATAHKNINTS